MFFPTLGSKFFVLKHVDETDIDALNFLFSSANWAIAPQKSDSALVQKFLEDAFAEKM